MMLLSGLLLALAALAGLAATAVHRVFGLRRRVREHEEVQYALRERMAERARVQANRERLEAAQRAAEGVVDAGTEGVRATHSAIAGIPFGVLDQIPPTRDAARIVRQVHNTTADGVYNTISLVNRLTGSAVRRGIHRPDRRPEERP